MNKEKLLKINLQIFANANTNTTGDAGMSVEMKTFYDMTLLETAQPELVHDQFAVKKVIPQGGGKVLEVRQFAPLAKALTPLTEGVTPDGNKLVAQSFTTTVAQYGDYITQSDLLEMTTIDNTIVEATKALGRQAGVTLDTLSREVLHSGSNVSYASKWSGTTETEVTARKDLDATSVLKVDTIAQIVAKLRSVNAPTINGSYVCIIHPYVAYDLMKDDEWKKPHEYKDTTNLYNGEIGQVAGVRFVQSSEAKINHPDDALFKMNKIFTCKTAISSSATEITIAEAITADEATKMNAIIGDATGDAIAIYVGGVANTITAVTAGAAGSAKITIGTAITSLSVGAVICGQGGTKEGKSVFGCIFLADGAYCTTEIAGGNLQTIIKQKGAGEDPLNQRSTIGWKAVKGGRILIPDYLIRLECCSSKFSAGRASN